MRRMGTLRFFETLGPGDWYRQQSGGAKRISQIARGGALAASYLVPEPKLWFWRWWSKLNSVKLHQLHQLHLTFKPWGAYLVAFLTQSLVIPGGCWCCGCSCTTFSICWKGERKKQDWNLIFTNGSKLQLLQEGHPENAFRCWCSSSNATIWLLPLMVYLAFKGDISEIQWLGNKLSPRSCWFLCSCWTKK